MFVDIVVSAAGKRQWVGVIGDIDLAVLSQNCKKFNREGLSIRVTSCYGAPFELCDQRRDLVAMLITSLEVLLDLDIHDVCLNSLANSAIEKKVNPRMLAECTGWATSPDSPMPIDWKFFPHDIYANIADACTKKMNTLKNPPLTKYVSNWISMIRELGAEKHRISKWEHSTTWHYVTDVYDAVYTCLMGLISTTVK